MAIAVASFEGAAPAGSEVPDIGSLLADRLATKGVGQVVGPQALGAEAKADPSADDVKAWATKAGVEAVVVGRTTRTGRREFTPRSDVSLGGLRHCAGRRIPKCGGRACHMQ